MINKLIQYVQKRNAARKEAMYLRALADARQMVNTYQPPKRKQV